VAAVPEANINFSASAARITLRARWAPAPLVVSIPFLNWMRLRVWYHQPKTMVMESLAKRFERVNAYAGAE